jgi:hypothetical protein
VNHTLKTKFIEDLTRIRIFYKDLDEERFRSAMNAIDNQLSYGILTIKSLQDFSARQTGQFVLSKIRVLNSGNIIEELDRLFQSTVI